MKLLVGAWLIGTCAAAVVVRDGGGADCAPGFERESVSDMIKFRAACGAKLDPSGPYGVFAAPNGTSSGGRSLVGDYIPGTERSSDAVTIRRDLIAGQDTIIVAATDSSGETLLQSFTMDAAQSDMTSAAATLYESRDAAAAAAAVCKTCSASDILCQPSCQNPPQTCTFYSSCAEAALPCGSSGYALGYGLANCAKFMQRLSHFSAPGRAWIFRVMTCLQTFLIRGPLTQCGLTCAGLKSAAFGSHPACYVDSGVCDLPVADWVQLVITIRDDLLTLATLKQAVTTGGRCLGHYMDEVRQEVDRLKGELAAGGDKVKILAEMAVLKGVEKIFE
ncbi:hypothetical protein PWT90_01643 [Aphanocladium album]|nr:hypothetical protein PWT90_01643 [Aphanocladium album]